MTKFFEDMWYFPVNVCCLSYFHCAGMPSPPHPFWCEDEVCGGDSAPLIPSPTYSVGEGADGNYLTMPLARCYVVQCCAMITSRNLLPASVRMYVHRHVHVWLSCPHVVTLWNCTFTANLYTCGFESISACCYQLGADCSTGNAARNVFVNALCDLVPTGIVYPPISWEWIVAPPYFAAACVVVVTCMLTYMCNCYQCTHIRTLVTYIRTHTCTHVHTHECVHMPLTVSLCVGGKSNMVAVHMTTARHPAWCWVVLCVNQSLPQWHCPSPSLPCLVQSHFQPHPV